MEEIGRSDATGAPAGASYSLHAAAAASRLPAELPAPPPLEVQQQEAKFQAARKAMIKVINWQVRRYWQLQLLAYQLARQPGFVDGREGMCAQPCLRCLSLFPFS